MTLPFSILIFVGAGQCPARGRADSPPLHKIFPADRLGSRSLRDFRRSCHSDQGEAVWRNLLA